MWPHSIQPLRDYEQEYIYEVEMVMVIRSLFAITAFVAFGVLMWLAWKIAVFLFMLWIVVGIASSGMKGH
jgi:ABC-type multidrug transport system fused ATPase/permease subunit